MRIAGLYAITDPELVAPDRLADAVRAALSGGARILQYRNKPADAATRLREAKMLAALCREHEAVFVVNDDIQLALASGADGVHLGQQDGAVADARRMLGDNAVIGQTCHASLELAMSAQEAGASYVAFGRFFPSRTKPGASPADISLLPQARSALRIPVVAIGGITVENAPAIIAAGANAIAVIHDLFSAPDISGRARTFSGLFNPESESSRGNHA